MSRVHLALIQVVLGCLASNHIMAQEIVIDLGLFPSAPCIRTQLPKSESQSSQFGQRMVKASAKVFIEPTNPRTVAVAQFCARRIKDELSESKSATNLQLFSEVFQDALSRCVQAEDRGVRFVRAVVIRSDACE